MMRVLDLANGNSLIHGRHGYFLLPRHSTNAQVLSTYGEYCSDEARMYDTLLQKGQVVVEIGARYGVHTVQLAECVGENGKVICYEPQPQRFAFVQSQCALNRLSQVTAYPYAVANRLQHACYASNKPNKQPKIRLTTSTEMLAADEQVLPSVAIDEHLSGTHVNLLSIHAAAAALPILRGTHDLITSQQPALYINHPNSTETVSLLTWLMDADYRLWWHTPSLFAAKNFFAHPHNIFAKELFLFRVLCLPAKRAVKIEGLREITSPHLPHPNL